MTTLIAWVGVDQRETSSIYLASDSRFTWYEKAKWDSGRKLFASRTHPVILGYCGDVIFPSNSISQALDVIDSDVRFLANRKAEVGLDWLESFIRTDFASYPASQQREFTVVYATRTTFDDKAGFFAAEISWSRSAGWTRKLLAMPKESSVIAAYGSGKAAFTAQDKKWKESDVGRTSRAVFSAFCDHVAASNDPLTGGPPQLVGIYIRKPYSAVTFGVIQSGKRWLSGKEFPENTEVDHISWRDDLFQCCDGRTLKPLEKAQRHARPS